MPEPGDVTVDLAVPGCALAIGAHPDDIEFGCGATLAKWAAAGADVHLLVLTDGSKGSWDPGEDRVALVARREDEQRAAAAALGAGAVHFLRLVDGELENTLVERAAVCAAIRRVRPDVVLGHDPWKRYRLHPDHHRAGRLAIDGVVAARDPHFFPESGLEPHRPDRLLLFEAEVEDHVEDIGTTFAAKLAALLCHRSQWRSTMGIDDSSADPVTVAEQHAAFAARLVTQAEASRGRTGFELAEAFKRIEPL